MARGIAMAATMALNDVVPEDDQKNSRFAEAMSSGRIAGEAALLVWTSLLLVEPSA